MKPNITEYLSKQFHYTSFRTGQEEIIRDILDHKDVLGVLPTGSGKSLCYQLPAMVLPGTTIVVSPLISLMIDQVRELKANNFKSVIALNSFLSYQDRRHVYRNLSRYKLIYVSPELLQQKDLLAALYKVNIKLFVIDEAHCISQWGHEFRPDYLRLINVIESLHNPAVLALTATAPREVQEDIMVALNRPNINKHIYPIDRPNIAFSVEHMAHHQEKIDRLTSILSSFKVPTIIYFTSRKMAEKVSNQIAENINQVRVAYYHGGIEPIDRISIQQQFMNDQLDVICCTSAFGMGINKQNIRLVIHYHFPADIGAYIQEVGRAGRDGLLSTGIVLYSHDDKNIHENMIYNEFPSEPSLKRFFNIISRYGAINMKINDIKSKLLEVIDDNEVHWRFLQYQLEKHDIIKGDKLHYDQNIIDEVYNHLISHIQKRLEIKLHKLSQMIHWLNEDECLRIHLYDEFQSSYKHTENCCNLCGFSLNNWQPEETSIGSNKKITWVKKLEQLFMIGAYDEAR